MSIDTDPKPGSVKSANDAKTRHSTGFSDNVRLNTKTDYSFVFRKNRRHADKFWILLAHKSRSGAQARLGLAIAKKRAKRAVDRNRLKRIAREAFRHQQSHLSGYHLVVMNKDGADKVSAAVLRQSLDRLLEQVGNASEGSMQ